MATSLEASIWRCLVVIPRALLIPPDLAGSAVHVDTAPAGDFAIALTRNGVSVASITLHADASATLATSANAPVAIAAGDVVRFVAPATPDASITGISLTIAARRLA
jgi:acyl dehydratase